MPTYVMLTNLTADGIRTLKNNPGRVAEVNKEVEQIGAKVLAQYATLGQYDFVTIVEDHDEQTMAKVSVELGPRARAALRARQRGDRRRRRVPAAGRRRGRRGDRRGVAGTRRRPLPERAGGAAG